MGILDRSPGIDAGLGAHLLNPDMRLLQAALALVADNGQIGGLHGLVERFRVEGLESLITSWIGDGQNLPITRDQIEQVLGDGHLDQISEETGMMREDAAEQLGDMLPGLIDGLTPEGRAPEQGLGDLGTLVDRTLEKRGFI
jgi:uncharacterized protein YidB (DUF937 family)